MLLAINWGNALIVTFFGFAIVLVVLILISIVLGLFGKIMVTNKKEQNNAVSSADTKPANGTLSASESAAIAMALYQYCDAHDEETHVLTMHTSEHPYHPWSSKIYGINNLNK